MNVRNIFLQAARAAGAVVGYGSVAAFLWLITVQIYRWIRQGEWTHIGVSEGLSIGLGRCCVKDGDTGRLAALFNWLNTPMDWLGMHKLLEVIPASLALFVLAIAGNCIFIYCGDRIAERKSGG